MADFDKLLARLAAESPEAWLLEPRDVYDRCLIDVEIGPSLDPPDRLIAVYGVELCVEAIKAWLECDETDALEWFSFNTAGAWIGPLTPAFRWQRSGLWY
jgi:hypothetical protein